MARIATRIRAGRSGDQASARTTDFSVFRFVQIGSGVHQPRVQWGPELFHRGKATGRDVDHSPPPSNVEVKNEWSYTAAPPTCLEVWTGKNLLLTYTFLFIFSFYCVMTTKESQNKF